MDGSRRRVVQFLEKEIKTYAALALYLTRTESKEPVRVGGRKILLSPAYYKERMKEAKKLVNELRKQN